MHEGTPLEVAIQAKARSIWTRARSNAFAHKLALARLSKWSAAVYVIQTVFIVIPILCVGIGLNRLSSIDASRIAEARSEVAALGLVSIVASGLALFVGMLSSRFQWGEKRLQHQNAMAGYQLLAQKSRRLADPLMSGEDQVTLARHLEEMFEVYKAGGVEPDDADFEGARALMSRMLALPFGLGGSDFELQPERAERT